MTDSWDAALARYVLRDIAPESLPGVALRAVLAGVDSVSLAALAGEVSPAQGASDIVGLYREHHVQ